MKTVSYLSRLEKIKYAFTEKDNYIKIQLLNILARRRLENSQQIRRFYDLTCFMYAYPGDVELSQLAHSILQTFAQRTDLIKYKKELINSGISGTSINYQFFWPHGPLVDKILA